MSVIRNKEEILFECVPLGPELLRSAIDAAAASGGSALDKLQAAMHAYALVVLMKRLPSRPAVATLRRRKRGP